MPMSQHQKAKSKARKILEQRMQERRVIDWDVNDLKTAAHYYWMGDIPKAAKIFFSLMNRIIDEPLKGTKEYEDGQRKPEVPIDEQEEEESKNKGRIITFEDLFTAGDSTPDAPQPEPARDEKGYIIEDERTSAYD